MVSLTIKGIPDEVYRTLKDRAEANRRSLNQEVIVGLEAHARRAAAGGADLLRRIDALRKRIGGPALTEREIRGARRKGRP